ncbi:carbohydrate-binding domain-containing protein [Propionimicrobium sp. PCR01-08-3]|uniref:carbohydrate-binding domain-containing protein n=1 Tax=Propionimicrobium sp. PCR01-08-3 TaxID=3052086 RepID=UPI00255D0303|nr:carbohydrate-binding domain-containing protein [Propionimicrobium sp. PCR01-08-3]WIY83557.1 carbohydrate-binding domain-containing protein [Propionimicrobium sp. PCR01-08-3]
MRRSTKIAAGLIASILMLTGCGTAVGSDESASSTASPAAGSTAETTTSNASSEPTTTSAATDSTDVDWSALPTTEVTLTDEGLAITETGTYVLSGSSTGQVTVNADGDVRIILSNATINSSVGAAIQVDQAELTAIELADGTTNTISDAATRSDEEIDGAIYSSDDLFISGTGTLNVTANFADGIVGKDNLTIDSGTINVTSVDDGIRGTDSLTINGGTIAIDATGDGMKSSNDTDQGMGQLTITGGDITISTGDDAVKAEQQITIGGGTLNITQSVEGIEAPVIVIDDGTITLNASDDGINASTSAIITSGLSVTINGGSLTIVMGEGDTDAIDSNGDLTINDGTIDITAQSPFDYDGTGALNGGTVTVNGEQVSELTNQMMGGGMGGGMAGGPGAR